MPRDTESGIGILAQKGHNATYTCQDGWFKNPNCAPCLQNPPITKSGFWDNRYDLARKYKPAASPAWTDW